MKFWLEIELGNDAMNGHPAIAEALREVGRQLDRGCTMAGNIRDANGNRVGVFKIVE